jgi:hypothetical protein
MLGTPLNTRVRRTLGVSLSEGLALTFVDTPTVYFPANIQAPDADNSTFEGSPRTGLTSSRLAWKLPLDLKACDRVEALGGEVYELLADARPLTAGRSRVGFAAPVLPVAELYPRTAELRILGADAPLATVECAVFQGRETTGGRGKYTDTFCELPPSTWEHFQAEPKKNRELVFADGPVWKLAEAVLGAEVPFVTATLRKAS